MNLRRGKIFWVKKNKWDQELIPRPKRRVKLSKGTLKIGNRVNKPNRVCQPRRRGNLRVMKNSCP